ncbi:chromosome segregation protein SMC [Uliginosibacterium sediminicola]|uniref:Chromosome partition protein Smc n=1 Tax=Uliginosibacterium sediminicola TaxID=2024550 RepID=A0ABU9Z0B4_9RHOO
MRLSKLKLAGFKSFVDPTTVLTPGQLVGIVGPNGCGKSNLIDAVRWVLGESRASALRGESMQDVIFSGSTTRKPVSRASVELIFDNADGRAAGQWSQYAEIAVKRVVERSGTSDYFINNVHVRRKDVIDLFLGTGLGPRAYAIIEQGMISRVIEARPEEVRGFLEEAAGITKYKERRRETEGRLADARDNLARLEDLRAELGAQINRLASQAEVARQYRSLNDSLRARQTLLWTWKLREGQAALARADQQIADSGRQLEAGQEQLRQLEAALLGAREQHTRFAESVGQAQGDVYAIAAEVSRIENELRALREQRERLLQRRQQLAAAAEQWRGRAEALAFDQEKWATQREQAETDLIDARGAADGAQALQPDAEARLADARKQLDALRRELALAEQHIQVEHTRAAAAERALQSLAQRSARIAAEQGALSVPAAEALPTAQAALQAAQSEFASLQTRLQAQQVALDAAQQAQRQAQADASQADQQRTALQARLDALQALQSRLRDQGDLAAWLRRCGLEGVDPLWQQLSVEAGWELALEAVLRERLGARGPVSAETEQAALASAAPATSVLLRAGEFAPVIAAGAAPDQARSLRELVHSSAAHIAPLLDQWLAQVFVVDSLEPWLSQQLPAGCVLVSKSGQLLSAGELSLFAPDARTHGVLERQREISALQLSLAQAEALRTTRRAALAESEHALQTAQQALASLRSELGRAQQSQHQAQLELQRAQDADARYQERRAQFEREAAEVLRLQEAEQAQLGRATEALAQHEESREILSHKLGGAEDLLYEAEQGHSLSRQISEQHQRALREAEFALRECSSKLDDIARNTALVGEELRRNEEEQAQLADELGTLDESSLQTSLQTALQLREAREAELARRRQTLDELAASLRQQDEQRLRSEQALEPLREALAAGRLARQGAEMQISQAQERLQEMSADSSAITAEALAEVRETALTREVARLTREIAELGPVNLAALDELASTSQRKEFLDAQNDDLTQAIDTLEDAIRRIDRETREQLMATYNTVSRHFGELFPQLFGGGQAALVLTGDEILDAGIQIVAQPPGKKNTSIQLLSGGEKALTAIALVFAMFQLNPAPFCMLDEVDAPLDDANTERYCEMVKRMSSVTQFVFISHSKITMERAQQLVGVTMQEQGVSRVVEVDMETALKLAETPAAAPNA